MLLCNKSLLNLVLEKRPFACSRIWAQERRKCFAEQLLQCPARQLGGGCGDSPSRWLQLLPPWCLDPTWPPVLSTRREALPGGLSGEGVRAFPGSPGPPSMCVPRDGSGSCHALRTRSGNSYGHIAAVSVSVVRELAQSQREGTDPTCPGKGCQRR